MLGRRSLHAHLLRDVHVRSPSYERSVFQRVALLGSGVGTFQSSARSLLHPSRSVVTSVPRTLAVLAGFVSTSRPYKARFQATPFGCPGERSFGHPLAVPFSGTGMLDLSLAVSPTMITFR